MYINKVILYGNLTRDPEMRALSTGNNVANFSIATNRVFRDRDGKKQEQVEYHNIVVFGRTADLVNQYLRKGSAVFIEGRIQTRSWEKDGQKHYRTEIVAENVQFGPKSSGGSSGGSNYDGGSSYDGGRDEAPADSGISGGSSGIEYPKDDINPDDIPF